MTQHATSLPGAASEQDEFEAMTDTRKPLKLGLKILSIGFGGFLLWAAFAPLAEGVPTPGTVSIATKRKPIQHLSGGLLEEIYVREGESVKEGQILAKLNDAVAKANFESARQHYMGLQAMESRLIALQSSADEIRFPVEVSTSSDAMVQQQVANQLSLFVSQKAGLNAELSAMREAISGQQIMIEAYQADLAAKREQYASLQDELAGIKDLVAEGYLPLAKERDLRRQIASVRGAISQLSGNIDRTFRTIAEINQKIIQRRQAAKEQSESQLAAIRLELQADREKFNAASQDLARTIIRSPVAGQVVGLQLQSKGAVLQPAQKLMDIVPANEELVIETRILPQFAERVKEGEIAEVQFSTFANSPSVVVDGKIKSVSRDLLAEATPNGTVAYYSARIVITPEGLKKLGNRQMKPGMPVEIILKTGERTLLQYLLKPLTERFTEAMREN